MNKHPGCRTVVNVSVLSIHACQTQATDAAKPTSIHPAVRKLLGKSVRAADVQSLLTEPRAPAIADRYTRRHIANCTYSSSQQVCRSHP